MAARQNKTRKFANLALERATFPHVVIEKLEVGVLVRPTAHAWQSDSGNDLLAPYAREKLPDAIVAPKRIVETTNRHEIIGPTGQGLANQPHLNTHLTETARNRPYPTCDEMHIDTVHLTHEAQNVAAAIHMYIIFGVSRKTAYEIAQMTRVLLYVNQKSEFHSRIN